MKINKSKLAFSLIELSVVILIIGVLVIGITKGSRIIRASKLQSAQSLTNSSPVHLMDNMILWLETTLDKSFVASEAVDTPLATNGTITTWKDINPYAQSPNNPVQTGAANTRPRYIANGINGLPSLNFNGSTNYFTYDGSGLVGSSFTIFVVERHRTNSTTYFMGGLDQTTNRNLHISAGQFDQYSHGNYYDAGTVNFSQRLHSYVLRVGVSREYYRNGVFQTPTCCGNPDYDALLSYNGPQIGRVYTTAYFNGDLGEIIMFKKALTNAERISVEGYLKTKWGIK